MLCNMKYLSGSAGETEKIGYNLASQAEGGEVYLLYGDLGAGKTTFMHGFINYFLPQKRVLSPTFIIVRHYEIHHELIKNLFHIDLYRLANTKEIKDVGIPEMLNKPDTVVAVEWAEKIEDLKPDKRTEVYIKVKEKSQREIKVISY